MADQASPCRAVLRACSERLSWSRPALFGAIAAYALGSPLAMAGFGAEPPADRGIALAPITLAEQPTAEHPTAEQPTAEQPSPEQKEARQALDKEEASLAQQLANPVAALVSIPFQWNWDDRIGAREDINRLTLNIQPVVPINLSKDWNLISRTILPVIHQSDANSTINQGRFDNGVDFGDTVQSLFVSPSRPGPWGLIWGLGPVALLPTGTNTFTTANQWALGPTGVVLKQSGRWTVGVLANHLWSVQNRGRLADVNNSFVQPFISYTTPTAWTATLQTETSYNWQNEQLAVPINFVVTKILKLGDQLVSVGAGVRYWAEGPEQGPHGWAGRVVFTLLLPKKS
jgi:hypothetical protein